MASISENTKSVMEKVERAAKASGRNACDITVVGVTKTQTPQDMKTLYECGIKVFGENRVQELLEKQPLTDVNPEWHLIGHLQRNKVKSILGKVSLIQSVESVALAQEIEKHAKKSGIIADILIEINIEEESTKFGISPDGARAFFRDIKNFQHLRPIGIMCVAPFVENQEQNRKSFRKMRNIFVDIKDENKDNDIRVLSMGMTGDFETAIEEGATMVRIGTGFFGERR